MFFVVASSDASMQSNTLHHEMIILFEKELVLQIVLVLGQEMDARENVQYNLLMMEILHHLLKTQDPVAVARSYLHDKMPVTSRNYALAAKLKKENQQRRSLANARHGHFGGTWLAKKVDGNTSYFTAAKSQNPSIDTTLARRMNRKAEPFIGSGKALLSHTRKACIGDSPATHRANLSLHKFCNRFITDCYGPVMKSLKNEFRRDSHRLEASDKVVFFRIVWFFCQWWRFSRSSRRLGQLIFTMDVFTFNLVLTSTDTFYQHKNYGRLAQAVALYSEMINLLLVMRQSTDKTESAMAIGLQDRLFYGVEPLDRLPKLLTRWSPGLFTRGYLCDLAELCHVGLKILELNSKDYRENNPMKNETQNDNVMKMIAAAAQFDVGGYFRRRIVSNQLVSMYSHLLEQYRTNSSVVNHRVVSMLLRFAKTEIFSREAQQLGVPANPLGRGVITLEPMLFRTHLLLTAGKILEDQSIEDDKEFQPLVGFSSNLLSRFLETSRHNPLIFVECLFRHHPPHKFCELFANQYISEELQMIGERELLLRDQRQYNGSGDELDHTCTYNNNDEDDSENEFDNAPRDGAPSIKHDRVAAILSPQDALSKATRGTYKSNQAPANGVKVGTSGVKRHCGSACEEACPLKRSKASKQSDAIAGD